MAPSSEERIQALLARGVMPSDATAIIRDTDARDGKILSESEAELLAISTDATIESDLLWIYWTPDIPTEYKRLWSAQDVVE